MEKFEVSLGISVSRVTIDGDFDGSRLPLSPENSLIITDENLAARSDVGGFLSSTDIPRLILPAGEAYKNIETVEKIAEAAIDAGLDRGAVFCGIGGGVICDMSAFAASIYMRGCRAVLVPSSLLSMVDASIGGKTGVDFKERKNMLGTFYPATDVTVFCGLLRGLPESEFRSGLAEVIKHGLLTDGELLSFIDANREAVRALD